MIELVGYFCRAALDRASSLLAQIEVEYDRVKNTLEQESPFDQKMA